MGVELTFDNDPRRREEPSAMGTDDEGEPEGLTLFVGGTESCCGSSSGDDDGPCPCFRRGVGDSDGWC